jgi:hypothetical protein
MLGLGLVGVDVGVGVGAGVGAPIGEDVQGDLRSWRRPRARDPRKFRWALRDALRGTKDEQSIEHDNPPTERDTTLGSR